MARGWDSKAIEDQIAEAEAAKAIREKPAVSREERESVARLRSLELSRVNVHNRPEAARDERYRVQLRAALDHLDNEIREFEPPSDSTPENHPADSAEAKADQAVGRKPTD